MKALNLHGIGDLRYDEVPMPQRSADEVLLKIKAVGICGSDISRVFSKGTYHFPTVIGHEFSGEIVDAEDTDLIGKGASVFPLLPCGSCAACQTGHYAQCSHYGYYGSRQNGAMAEYLAVKKQNLCILPKGVSYEEAAMNEPAAVALHAFRKAKITVGDSLLIYGIGTIGLIIAQWARSAGVRNIILAGRTDEKLNVARRLGFVQTVDTREPNWKDNVLSQFGLGVDACIEGTGCSDGLEACLYLAKNFGTVVSMGNPNGDMHISQDAYWKILRKELNLVGTWNSSYRLDENDWKQALDGMQCGAISLKPLITHRFLLQDYKSAFSLMHEKKEMYIKVMFVTC